MSRSLWIAHLSYAEKQRKNSTSLLWSLGNAPAGLCLSRSLWIAHLSYAEKQR
nr:hypothetical protein [Leptospira interrogans]